MELNSGYLLRSFITLQYCSKIFWFLNFRVMSGRARICNFYGNNHNHHHHHQQKKSFKKQQNRNKTSYYDSNKALWLPWPPVLPGFSTLFWWKKYLVMSAVDHYLLLVPGDLPTKTWKIDIILHAGHNFWEALDEFCPLFLIRENLGRPIVPINLWVLMSVS